MENINPFDSTELAKIVEKYSPFFKEVRKRILFTLAVFAVTTIFGFVFYEDIIRLLVGALSLEGVNIVFDAIGGEVLKGSFKILQEGGTLVSYGFYQSSMGNGGSVPLDFLRLQFWKIWPNKRSTKFYSIGSWRKKHADWFKEDLI